MKQSNLATWIGLCLLAGCGTSVIEAELAPNGRTEARVLPVCGPDITTAALTALFEAREGDVVQFCAGRHSLDTGLLLHGKQGITLRGAGMDETILSFAGSDSAEGINVSHADGIVIEQLTVEDTPGNGIRIFRSNQVTLRQVRARWRDAQGRTERDPGYTPRAEHGAYALYPVETRHVLLEDCEAHGASDAGVYVGQSTDVIVRRCLATYNVAGYEFENTYRAIFEDNVATRNTGGFLVFDLPDLMHYGESNIVRRNRSFANNTPNFAPVGNIVGLVPRGTGMLVLASDRLIIEDNEIHDNDTVGIAIINFGLAIPDYPDQKFDFFPEGIEIRNNRFRDNGGRVQEPDPDRGSASLLPTILALKNGGRSAHIVWDGAVDTLDPDCPIPVDADGIPFDQPNPSEVRLEARLDPRGRPNFQRSDPEPACKYNAWKFDAEGRLKPENGLFITEDNVFANTRPETALVADFLNARFTSSDSAIVVRDLLRPASNDLTPHRGRLAPAVTTRPLALPFTPQPGRDGALSAAETARLCAGGAPDAVNFEAALRANCPRLSDYRLFLDPEDPRAGPRERGAPYRLNSALFSDYSMKYRFLFIPPGERIQYREGSDANSATDTLVFPVGSILAKTFTFPNGTDEDIVETRLLIHRRAPNGGSVWVGLPYVWETGPDGRREALLAPAGALKADRVYDYTDPDPEVRDATGAPRRYRGQVARYRVPAALNCITCHADDSREAGAAPIGPKARNLNLAYGLDGPEPGQNQLVHLARRGLLDGLPPPDTLPRLTRWDVPGDSGHRPDSPEDIHARARAYLEINCAHCHQPQGGGSNSALYLDSLRPVNRQYGICKKPVAAGRGSGGLSFDIVPGKAADSILAFRLASSEPGVRMPPIARSVTHGEAVDLIARWIDTVLPTDDTEDHEACTTLLGQLLDIPLLDELGLPLPGVLGGLRSPTQRLEGARHP